MRRGFDGRPIRGESRIRIPAAPIHSGPTHSRAPARQRGSSRTGRSATARRSSTGRPDELGPIRVNAVSPGVIDTGIWDSLGPDGKEAYFRKLSARNPARRIGTVDDVASAVLFAMTNTFLTGVTLRVDGGEPLT